MLEFPTNNIKIISVLRTLCDTLRVVLFSCGGNLRHGFFETLGRYKDKGTNRYNFTFLTILRTFYGVGFFQKQHKSRQVRKSN